MTTTLEAELSKAVVLPDGTKINGKRYAASIVRQAIETGEVTLANGNTMQLAPDEIIALLRWAYSQIDGPPPSKHEVTGADGAPIQIINVGEDLGKL